MNPRALSAILLVAGIALLLLCRSPDRSEAPKAMLAAAAERPWHYPVQSVRVIDGDTSAVVLDLGFGLSISRSLRVLGVDTPEKKTIAGQRVKSVIESWSQRNSPLLAKYVKEDKFGGRFDGDLVGSDGQSLSEFLLDRKLARPYRGDAKPPWTQDELDAIERIATQLITP